MGVFISILSGLLILISALLVLKVKKDAMKLKIGTTLSNEWVKASSMRLKVSIIVAGIGCTLGIIAIFI